MDENMKLADTIEQLRNAAALLREYAKAYLTEDDEKTAYNMPRMTELFNLIFPMIIQDYELPAFAGRREEINVWVSLLGEIVRIMAEDDTLAKVDILGAVLIPNMEEHMQILQGIKV